MARTTTERKKDFIGIPMSEDLKARIVRLAKRRGRGTHTEMSREALEEYVAREEKSFAKAGK